jgi:hypothetical protein
MRAELNGAAHKANGAPPALPPVAAPCAAKLLPVDSRSTMGGALRASRPRAQTDMTMGLRVLSGVARGRHVCTLQPSAICRRWLLLLIAVCTGRPLQEAIAHRICIL